jgi:hypothetical protein
MLSTGGTSHEQFEHHLKIVTPDRGYLDFFAGRMHPAEHREAEELVVSQMAEERRGAF